MLISTATEPSLWRSVIDRKTGKVVSTWRAVSAKELPDIVDIKPTEVPEGSGVWTLYETGEILTWSVPGSGRLLSFVPKISKGGGSVGSPPSGLRIHEHV